MAMNVVFLESEFEVYVMCNGVSLCLDSTTRSTVERYLILCRKVPQGMPVHRHIGTWRQNVSPRAVQLVVLRESHYWSKTPTKRASPDKHTFDDCF
jgi:hypothetical protein